MPIGYFKFTCDLFKNVEKTHDTLLLCYILSTCSNVKLLSGGINCLHLQPRSFRYQAEST